MTRASLRLLLACAVLCAAAAGVSAGQTDESAEKRAAIRKLIELTGPVSVSNLLFERLVTEYESTWAEGVIAGMKAEGLFAKLTPEQTARIEQLIREFGANAFREIKRRVREEVNTPANFERFAAPAFDRHLTLAEINELNRVLQTPAGRKLLAAYPKVAAAGALAVARARGLFDQTASPEAATARAERLGQELKTNPSGEFQRYLAAAAPQLRAELTEEELRELQSFYETPHGRRIAEATPQLLATVMETFFVEMAPTVSALVREVLNEEFEKFEVKAKEVFTTPRPSRAPRGTGRRRTGN